MTERQITTTPSNHQLTNVHCWSHDGAWIYYDVRSSIDGSVFDGERIERVHVASGRIEVVYRSQNGACVGVVTANPVDDKIVFIAGPEHPTDDWRYAFWHRRGIVVSPSRGNAAWNLDACDVTAPYTPGALRGGSHVHVFSGDGQWVSFTYEDHVLATKSGAGIQSNQRNVGVSFPARRVTVPPTHPRNHDGEYFSVVVTRTYDSPEPGSDQINRAYEDAWIGNAGYLQPDGRRRHRALAFIGDCVSTNGTKLPELFVVELPDDLSMAGDEPLCGTESTRPAPPRGVIQRRLTFTGDRRFPGLAGVRHWPRSHPDGSKIAFLMRDDLGIVQLWLISPQGTDLRQLTRSRESVASTFTFRHDGAAIACIIGTQVCEVDVDKGTITPRTPLDASSGPLRPEACVYSLDGRQLAYTRTIRSGDQAWNQVFLVDSIYR